MQISLHRDSSLLYLLLDVCVLELQVELFPSLEGSSQECGLGVDSALLLRNGEELMLWKREDLNYLKKLRPR